MIARPNRRTIMTLSHARLIMAASIAISLTACAALTPGSIVLGSGKALLASEAALDAAVTAATVAVSAGLTSQAQNATIAALAPKANAARKIAEADYATGKISAYGADSAAMSTITTQLTVAH